MALHLSWEVDPECLDVLQTHFPDAQHRGDFLKDDPAAVAEILKSFDPSGSMIVVFVGAPPCPDFSRIVEDAPGAEGSEGQKFTAWCAFANKIEMALPHMRIAHLTENVVMSKNESEFFANRLDCGVVLCDSADLGMVNRPRLWWTRIPWPKFKFSPVTGEPLRWSKKDKHHQIHCDFPLQEPWDIDMPRQWFSDDVCSHRARIPCFTTPAPQEGGRPPPKRLKGRLDPKQRARWLSDDRTFAPWQYHDNALVQNQDKSWSVPSSETKEQLHMLPKGFTKGKQIPERSRHRMIANGWHVGVARFMMMLVLQAVMVLPRAQPVPVPGKTAIQTMLEVLSAFPPEIGPGNWQMDPVCVPRQEDQWHHWKASKTAQHYLQRQPHLEPGLRQCLEIQQMIGGSLNRLRSEVVEEVKQMIEDAQVDTASWWSGLSAHVAQVYYDVKHKEICQIPTFIHLLQLTGMPGLDDLAEDLTLGFQIVGELHSGAGWLPRTDSKYEYPISDECFRRRNRQHTLEKLRSKRVDPHWKPMYDELKSELEQGRMNGPFASPSWWPASTISLEGRDTLPPPPDHAKFAFCFSVVQQDKIRRCEDLKRSHHNDTVVTHDVPAHHDVSTFVQLARQIHCGKEPPSVWTQDLQGAYRQFPVRDPSVCFCVLMTPQGPLLLQHNAMMFGAASSVWGFNRAADALMFLGRRLLNIPIGHYVDDYIAVEGPETVHSGFDEFAKLARSLGLRMKESKASPPSNQQKVLGVSFSVTEDAVVLRPHPSRCQKVTKLLNSALLTNQLSPETAQHLAGKLNFMTATMFGQLGKAALVPVYSRAHGLNMTDKSCQLNGPLQTALRTLKALLQELQPRVIPCSPSEQLVTIYTDAYFVLDGRDYNVGSSEIPSKWKSKHCHTFENGWGFVIRFGQKTWYSAGRVPPWLLKLYCSRRAYIYFLEICAQLVAFVVAKDLPSTLLLSYIDNAPGLFALRKGFCKDVAICNVVAITWRLIARLGWHLQLQWVASSNNISDKVSRFDFSDMAFLDADFLETNLDQLFDILSRVAVDTDFAHSSEALDAILAVQLVSSPGAHTGRVGKGASVAEKGSALHMEVTWQTKAKSDRSVCAPVSS